MLTLENQSEVTSVEFNHDGTKIVSGCFDNTISIWNIDEKSDKYGENILTLNDHSASIKSVGFNHNSTLIVSGSYDKTIRVWNVDNKSNYYGKCILILEGHTKSVTSVGFNHDGTKIVSGSNDITIRLWNLKGNLSKKLILVKSLQMVLVGRDIVILHQLNLIKIVQKL